MLYFIQSGSKIKIGYSANPLSRFRTIYTASPEPCGLVLTIHLPNEAKAEKALHHHFRAHRTNGEWFEINVYTAFRALIELKLIPEHEAPTLEMPTVSLPPMHPGFEKWFLATQTEYWSEKDIVSAKADLGPYWQQHHGRFTELLDEYQDIDKMIHMEQPLTDEEARAFMESMRKALLEKEHAESNGTMP
ncbi:Meiotically Up-regulated Gene 113 (MUG113) protein [Roseimicrobium gellanilyticum]|uniref:Meiotically Up-regulated Gene 113 (MUG113) protein n=1 Tax=Roseimicrobium gellanilyticum TaxID=748857 RepID=A0A366HFZ0_9BACT|nr:GIY-YIG nuclease family protein [Roseimicrobium gellanilyticum]RBP41428.1 Meiotically Up-regulated Gene 113 (MUG113) protein [Roseimicrobium gellanilyticum]